LIVSSHVANNPVEPTQVGDLIRDVYRTLTDLRTGTEGPPIRAVVATGYEALNGTQLPNPAVPIKTSVTRQYIVCLEDGKKLKTLKRHLMTSFNMTPEQYRARWGLPANYPMVAPEYAERRSAMAKQNGLGRRADDDDLQDEPVAIAPRTPAPAKVAIRQIPVGVSGIKKRKQRRAA
jgi:predicted transcriptional regulator